MAEKVSHLEMESYTVVEWNNLYNYAQKQN